MPTQREESRQEFEIGPYRFEAGPVPEDTRRVAVQVFRDGEPLLDLHGTPFRKAFAAGAKPERIAQFCERFATDEAFRTGTLLKHAFSCC